MNPRACGPQVFPGIREARHAEPIEDASRPRFDSPRPEHAPPPTRISDASKPADRSRREAGE